MKGEWCYFRGHFSPETCNRIIDNGLKLSAAEARIGFGHHNTTYRRSKVRFIDGNDPNFRFLTEELWELAQWANRTWFNFEITRLPYVQLAEYDESYQGEYKKHHDVFWMNDDPVHHRKLTCVVQLCPPESYEGGNLELFDTCGEPEKELIREQGTAFFFPSFIPHQATAVTKGTRYSLAAWFDGPKWR